MRRLEDPVAVGIDLARDAAVKEVVGLLDPSLPGPRARERGDAGQPVAVVPVSCTCAGKVVVPCPMMALPLFLFLCEGFAESQARANSPNRSRGR